MSATRCTGSAFLAAALAVLVPACGEAGGGLKPVKEPEGRLLEDIERRTFLWFWDKADPRTGLVPDREPTPSFSSVAAVGFGLTACTIGAERGYVSRADAAQRARTTLEYFASLPQGPEPTGRAGYKGFFYHFLDMRSGLRYEQVELSSIDTTIFLAGALACREYFVRDTPVENAIRERAELLYRRVEWPFFVQRAPLASMGWTPEEGFNTYDWRGYNEAMILYVLALGSPTHPLEPEAWSAYTSSYVWADYYGHQHVNFAPLFGHQLSHVWIDFRGIRDAYMRQKGIDYFENSRRATLAQRDYAIDNPGHWEAYGASAWGLSACDGPTDAVLEVGGRSRRFFTYAARGAAANEVRDDGTIAPTAALGSLPFAPEAVIPAVRVMVARWGTWLYGDHGFVDAFNPTFKLTDVPIRHGRVVSAVGWFDTDRLGIDQGPIVAMIENHRSGLVWSLMRRNPWVVDGLRKAGFEGGWLDERSR